MFGNELAEDPMAETLLSTSDRMFEEVLSRGGGVGRGGGGGNVGVILVLGLRKNGPIHILDHPKF